MKKGGVGWGGKVGVGWGGWRWLGQKNPEGRRGRIGVVRGVLRRGWEWLGVGVVGCAERAWNRADWKEEKGADWGCLGKVYGNGVGKCLKGLGDMGRV